MPLDAQRRPDSKRSFVGRDEELATLTSCLGRGRLVLIGGEAGIGKTRLVEEVADAAQNGGTRVCWGRCWEGEGAPAFWPWIEIVGSVVRATDTETLRAHLGAAAAADLTQFLGEARERAAELPAAPHLAGTQSRFPLFGAISGLLARTARTTPLLLVLEDLHWADTPSLLLLKFLAREIDTAPLLLIATYRDSDVAIGDALADALGSVARHRHCERMMLGGLGEADVQRYVEDVLGADAAKNLASSLYRETDGNPFFLAEIVRLLPRGDGGADAARTYVIPQTVRDLIARRLRAYSPECIEVLRTAAVVGRAFTLAVLQRIPELESVPVLDLVSAAVAGRLLVETPGTHSGYQFTHSLIREALYDALPLARRVQLHRSVGSALETHLGANVGARAAELAHHFLQGAASDGAERAVHWAIRAGEHAAAALAHEEAVAHFERALEAIEHWQPADASRMCSVLLALGDARVRVGDPAAAEETFLRAATLARTLGDGKLLARAALGLGEVERYQDRIGPLLEQALAQVGPEDSVLRVRLMSRLAVTLYWAQPADRKLALSADAVAMARRLGHTSTIAYALAGRIAALSGPDDVETRLAAATEMRELAERCDARELAMIARGWCVADSLALGHISDVRRDIETFAAAALELRHPYFVWWSTALRTMQALLDGRMKDAETLSEDAMRLASRAVVSDAMQVYAGHSYVLCIEQERHQQLESILTAFVQSFPHIPGTHCALALLHADRGRAVEAEGEMAALAADDFAALPRNPEWLSCIAALAETSALLPDAPYAATLYRLLAPYRDRVIVAGLGVLCSGSVARSLGLLATRLERFDEAAAHLDEALRVHERIGAVMWTAYTHHAYAGLAVARGAPGDAELAASSRATALTLAEKLGMTRLRRCVLAIDPAAMARPQRHVACRTGTLRLEGDYWLVRWGNTEFRLRDSVGLRYLATLIENPSREFLAFDLVTTRTGVDAAANASRGAAGSVTVGDAGPLLDRRARQAYGRRLDEQPAAVDEAQAFHDSDRARAAQAEIDALAGELARAVGLGGRGRRAAAPLERARVSATRAIHAAVRRIHENDASLAQYLGGTIKTGTFCSYTPDPGTPVSWTLR